jgi:putative spermidine/putrescine transport system substrate-binding protein
MIAAGAGARAEESAASGNGTTLAIATWGGAYGQSQDLAYFEPFTQKTGVKIKTETYDGTVSAIKDKLGDGSPSIDVVDLSAGALDTLCHDGLLEALEVSMLDPAPSGESASDDFLAGGLTSCGVASVAWSAALAFDRRAFSKAKPTKIADLLDVKRFPGKRALPDGPRYTLELALLADGVEPGNIYQ